jgi:hypothetical protein
MLSHEDNELLCRVGRGTPMGNLMRQYWIPALPSAEFPNPLSAEAHDAARRDDVPRQPGAHGCPGRGLPASRREPLFRAQRGMRTALRLPRLEIRHPRKLPRLSRVTAI